MLYPWPAQRTSHRSPVQSSALHAAAVFPMHRRPLRPGDGRPLRPAEGPSPRSPESR